MFDFDTIPDRRGTNSMKWEEGELPMWVADMDFPTAPAVREAVSRRAAHGVFGYTVVPDAWYDAYLGWWKTRHNFSMRREWLQFSTGVVPAVTSIVKRVTNVGDEVVLLTPVYDIFFHSVENTGRHVSECPLTYDGTYHIDFELLEEKLASKLATLFLLCDPHNPTGNLWTEEELQTIGALCKKHGVLVLSDEIHCDLTAPNAEYVPFLRACPDVRAIALYSASKAFNLAGLQSAAVCVPDGHLREIVVRGLNADEVAEPNCFACEATVAAFKEGGAWLDALRAYLFENRRIAEEMLFGKVAFVPSEATYLMWLDFKKETDALCLALEEKTGVRFSAGSVYRGNGARFLRANLACPAAQVREAMRRLLRFLDADS